jgi:hypothetical protein
VIGIVLSTKYKDYKLERIDGELHWYQYKE